MSEALQSPKPGLTAEEAVEIAACVFGLSSSGLVPRELGSERDQAWLLGAGHVLKVSNSGEKESTLDLEERAAEVCKTLDSSLPVAQPLLPPRAVGNGVRRSQWTSAKTGATHFVRCYPVLPGTHHEAGSALPDGTLREWGAVSARIGKALRSLSHPAMSRILPWDLQHFASLEPLIVHVSDERTQALCRGALQVFSEVVRPGLCCVRHQVVHGDLNLGNVLLLPESGAISGVIDFGDMTFTALVVDIAAILSNLGNTVVHLGLEEMLRMARIILDGYQSVVALEEAELRLLCDAWLVRCAVEVVLSSWRVGTGLESPERSGPDLVRFTRQMEFLLGMTASRRAACLCSAGLSANDASTEDLVARRGQAIGPGSEPLSYGSAPVHARRASGPWVWDQHRALLDMYNNVPCVGHCHPRVAQAIALQARSVNVNMRYLHGGAVSLAERLLQSMNGESPGGDAGLDTVLFCNSGSEANDLAVRLARSFTKGSGSLCTHWAYHGITAATVALSPETAAIAGHLPEDVERWQPPDHYRGLHLDSSEFLAAVGRLEQKGHKLACTILDPVLCSERILDLDPGYAQSLLEATHDHGGLWIADEVQSGHGRTGSHMWAFARLGLRPDLVTLGKPMGNGHPVAAVVTRREIAQAFIDKEGVFFSTFGGNPVSAAAGHAVLDVIEDERVLERVVAAGKALRAATLEVTKDCPRVGDVRGVGLVNSVEFVTDPHTKEPDTAAAQAVRSALRARGVLVGTTGQHSNCLKIRPPLAFTDKEVPVWAEALRGAIKDAGLYFHN